MLQFVPKLSSYAIYHCIVGGQLCPKPNRGRPCPNFIGSQACVQLLSHVSIEERIIWRCQRPSNCHGQTLYQGSVAIRGDYASRVTLRTICEFLDNLSHVHCTAAHPFSPFPPYTKNPKTPIINTSSKPSFSASICGSMQLYIVVLKIVLRTIYIKWFVNALVFLLLLFPVHISWLDYEHLKTNWFATLCNMTLEYIQQCSLRH